MGKARTAAGFEADLTPWAKVPPDEQNTIRDIAWALKGLKWSAETISDHIAYKYKVQISGKSIGRWFDSPPPDVKVESNGKSNGLASETAILASIEKLQKMGAELHKGRTPTQRLLNMADVKVAQMESIALVINAEVLDRLTKGKFDEATHLAKLASVYNYNPIEYLKLADWTKSIEEGK
jgi:hypothetical protein